MVVDAVADQDLGIIAEASHHMPLLTGGSALAMPLPDLYKKNGLLADYAQQTETPATGNAAIVFSGSCSAMTQKQVAHFKSEHPSYQLSPEGIIDGGLEAAASWLENQDKANTPMIYATAAPDQVKKSQDQLGIDQAGETVEKAMAELAQKAFALGYRRFIIAGGETSGAVAQALDVTAVSIGQEITPGVPWVFTERDGSPLALALKSGNFGGECFFNDALDLLGGTS